MSAEVETNIQEHPDFLKDPLTEEKLTVVTSAIQNAENLDQFLEQVQEAKAGKTVAFDDQANTAVASPTTSPQKLSIKTAGNVLSPRTILSPRSVLSSTRVWDPTQHIDSSDEEECTFQPKINANAGRLSKRTTTADQINEKLYKDAFERSLKQTEYVEAQNSHRDQTAREVKIHNNSMKIIMKKLQSAIKSLVKNAEDPETEGQLTFESLGLVFHRIGLFQNLEFLPQEKDGEKSSVHINQAKVKPERINREIQFHESFWDICTVATPEAKTISSDLVVKFLMVLVEEKCPVNESGYFLLEILDAAILKSESDETILKEIKEKKNLWMSLEKLVREFRRLFDDKTSFMAIYNSTNIIQSPRGNIQIPACTFTPEINKESIRLDTVHFDKNILKVIGAREEDLRNPVWRNRNRRLYNYAKYLREKKGLYLEQRIEEELAPCSFVPKTCPYKKPHSKGRVEEGSKTNRSNASTKSSKYAYFSQALFENNPQTNRHLVLYEAAKTYRDKLQQKSYARKMKDEKTELAECSFRPTLRKSYEHSPQRELGFYEGVPNGFKKTIERLHKGFQQTQTKQAELEKIPRGENYEKNRNTDFAPPTFLARPKIRKEEVLVSVDVSIGHGRTGRIGIHKNDNAKTLAKNFARTYSLNSVMRESLEKLLQSYIDTYFAQPLINHAVEEQIIPVENDEEHEESHNENENNEEVEENHEEPEADEQEQEQAQEQEQEEEQEEENVEKKEESDDEEKEEFHRDEEENEGEGEKKEQSEDEE